MLNRAYKISQTWQDFHTEIQHIKQTLVNNNYSNNLVDQHINTFIHNKFSDKQSPTIKSNVIPIFYKSQYHSNYKIEERIIKNIVKTNVKPIQTDSKVNIIVYYKNPKTCNLVIKNNLSPPVPQNLKTNVVYSFKCPFAHSNVYDYEYIGMTSVKLQNRLQNHTYSGSIKDHILHEHNSSVTKTQLLENTSILTHAENRYKLSIKEALLILEKAPIINRQHENLCNILKLHRSRNISSNNNSNNNALPSNNDVTHPSVSVSPADDSPNLPLLSQLPDNIQSPRLRHQASPQIIRQINAIFSNANNSPSTSPIPRRYNFRTRATQ